MIPVVTPSEMRAIDDAAADDIDVLLERAGRAVARAAVRLLGGTYGRRVVVVAGPGNNGADGRVAAEVLARRGVGVVVVDPSTPDPLPPADLVIDAAFGTGLSRAYDFPSVPAGVPVLAVDIPSGVDGLTGVAQGRVTAAAETITFVALKPGLLLEPGRSLAGTVRVEAIEGLEVDEASVHLVEEADVAASMPRRRPTDHKWRSAIRIVGGSPSMTGAVQLAASAAVRIAGYVEVAIPGRPGLETPREVVGRWLPGTEWGDVAAADTARLSAVLAGPGLADASELRPLLELDLPLVLDASALQPDLTDAIRARTAPTILTPHDGEFARLGGSDTADRIGATQAMARDLGAVVLRKGPSTVISGPDGTTRIVANGGPELASAGTGDVLAGIIAALVGCGADPLDAAAGGSWVHAAAGGARVGLVASDISEALPDALRRLGG